MYFATDEAPIKRVFFATSTDRIVVARIVPVEGVDSAGRGGRYLSHALVLGRSDFESLGGNPIALLASHPFAETIEEALERGDRASGDVPAVEVAPPSPTPSAGADWPRHACRALSLAALQAGELAEQRNTVVFRGSPEAIERALGVALAWVPPTRRSRCSFDSFFHRGNLAATYFWGIGLSRDAPGPAGIEVDAEGQAIRGAEALAPATAYEAWATTAIDSGDPVPPVEIQEKALALAELIDGASTDDDPVGPAGDDLVAAMVTANRSRVDTALRRAIAERAPEALVPLLFAALAQGLEDRALLERIRDGFDTDEIVRVTWETVTATPPPELGKRSVAALRDLAERTGHSGVRAAHAVRAGDARSRPGLLGALAADDYARLAASVLASDLDAARLAAPGQGAALVRALAAAPSRGTWTLHGLAEALLEIGEGASLGGLVPILEHRPPKERRKLAKVVGASVDVSPEVIADIRASADKVPGPIRKIGRSLRNILPF